MSRRTPRTCGDELLLARISAAAGREHIGKRRATYAAAVHTTPSHAVPVRVIRGLLAFARYGRPCGTKAGAEARLDLYERGMTIAVKGRIHVVRYDTTAVFRKSIRNRHDSARVGTTRIYTLIDVDGERVVLQGRPADSAAAEWEPEIQRAVTHAQLPWAWAALDNGERLTFGDIWLTKEKAGSGEVSARWPQVQQIEMKDGAISLNIDGNWSILGPMVSQVPNLFVLCKLVERLRADGTC
ncbi:hypothetical protein GCM10010211_65960 [Streptomyces albospinus]|uniref:Uncharacterized protein n=1 Tax=Streptomyces albospinus TaxID=285515 RepID=A0ABQ2VJ01_9ACTN|nr:DUF6585 family protein [Streptomyces albospinus]GGU90179.1 hypothetical protein GCM10010211_65960 [Streptomyces albospinus]